MERREDVLKQELAKNAYETERWTAFKEENKAAMKNLDMFAKKLTVEIMVPIGRKALMPGELIHTNELLVGHYQGYFSACSAHKAMEICQHRMQLADDTLKKLQVEADLWQNKLTTPILEGAVPNAGEIEIIEEFNEDAHNNWMKEHKMRLRKEKEQERKDREANDNGPDDVLKKLEEGELMEELGLDPDDPNEMELFELLNEARSEVDQLQNKDCDNETNAVMTDEQLFETLDKLEEQEQNDITAIDPETEQNLKDTQEMVRNLMKNQPEVKGSKQPERRENNKVEKPSDIVIDKDQVTEEDEKMSDYDDMDNDDNEETHQPEEVKLIREQMVLLPIEERVEFLNTQLGIIKAKMRKMQKECFISDELTNLMNVVVNLEDDLQEMLFEQDNDTSVEEQSDDAESLTEPIENKKRRISFAATDEQLCFKKNEPVSSMLPKAKQHERDIISLDAPLQPVKQEVSQKETTIVSTSPQIMQKVEQNMEFVKENQSMQDFDLVNQILEALTGRISTLKINFSHSEVLPASDDFDMNLIPSNPSHFYKLYKMALAKEQVDNLFPIYTNGFEGEEELKVPILNEMDRGMAYVDSRAEFSKPSITSISTGVATAETKSILRNKSAVKAETHAPIVDEPTPNPPAYSKSNKKNRNRNKKKQRTIDDDLRDMSAYQKVMHDLVEKEPTEPEPLPEGKYINANTPKKRISRFKEQRAINKT